MKRLMMNILQELKEIKKLLTVIANNHEQSSYSVKDMAAELDKFRKLRNGEGKEMEKIKKNTTELKVHIEAFHSIEGARETIEDIKKIAKENDCDCTLIEIHVAKKLINK